jgi:thymidylate synthase (FAD)
MKTAEISVELLDSMGDDLTVVNAARVSFDKVSELEAHMFDDMEAAEAFVEANGGEIDYDIYYDDRWYGGVPVKRFSEKDQKLIKFLARNNHWTPFGHVQATFRIKAPIFVARQLGKHQVGLVWNEVSRRYVDTPPEFYFPETWRRRAVDKKQGSSEAALEGWWLEEAHRYLENVCAEALEAYHTLLEFDVAPEQARMVLPQNTMTEWVWTGSLAAFARVVNLRLDPHAQQECQEVAREIDLLLRDVAPHSWSALTKGENV